MTALDQRIRLRIRVYGIVQGIGFRPFVARLADECKICGSVCNKGTKPCRNVRRRSRRSSGSIRRNFRRKGQSGSSS